MEVLDQLWVLSDLHLAPQGPLCEFRAARELEGTLRAIGNESGRVMLVLNGDVVDYLQLVGYESLALERVGERTEALVAGLGGNSAGGDVLAGLRAVVEAGHRILIVPGNHDPELALVDAQRVLVDALGAGAEKAVHFHLPDEETAEERWILRVGKRWVYGEHGHAGDRWNRISSRSLLKAQARGDAAVPLPLGSRLVHGVINPYRRARDPEGNRRFPFLDLVKPDLAAALLLLYLDPKLAAHRLGEVLLPSTGAIVQTVVRMLLSTDLLAETVGAPDPTDEELFARDLAAALIDAMDTRTRSAPRVVQSQLEAGLSGEAGAAEGTLAVGGAARGWLLRAIGKALGRSDRFLELGAHDELARDVISKMPLDAGTVAVAGHSHGAKRIALNDGRVYINTGTWQDLLLPPKERDQDSVASWIDELSSGAFEPLRRLTAARITSASADLMVWEEACGLRPMT